MIELAFGLFFVLALLLVGGTMYAFAWGAILAVPLGLLVLAVLGVRHLLRARPVAAWDPRWISAFDVAAGVLLMLATTQVAPRIVGAILAVGAAGAGTAEVERVRALLFAFLAGVTLLLAPIASVAIGISAAWRWVESDDAGE